MLGSSLAIKHSISQRFKNYQTHVYVLDQLFSSWKYLVIALLRSFHWSSAAHYSTISLFNQQKEVLSSFIHTTFHSTFNSFYFLLHLSYAAPQLMVIIYILNLVNPSFSSTTCHLFRKIFPDSLRVWSLPLCSQKTFLAHQSTAHVELKSPASLASLSFHLYYEHFY